MPYGNFYYGKNGFFFKKSGVIGARYNPSLGAICNQPQDVNNRYVPGSGVGASSTAQRRAMLINSYRTVPQGCGQGPQRLGIFAKGGSNMYALNWGLYGGCTIPTPINLKQVGRTTNSVTISFTNFPKYKLQFTNYQYSLDGVNFISFNPPQTTSPVTISGLNADTDYIVYLRAINGFVAGPTSAGLNATTRPLAPTSLQLVSSTNSNSVIINFVQVEGPSNISSYQYSIGGGSFSPVTSYDAINSTVTINDVALQTGSIYNITLRAISSPGLVAGNTSNPITVLVGAYQYTTGIYGSYPAFFANLNSSVAAKIWYINGQGQLYQQITDIGSAGGNLTAVLTNPSSTFYTATYYFYIPSSP